MAVCEGVMGRGNLITLVVEVGTGGGISRLGTGLFVYL